MLHYSLFYLIKCQLTYI